MIREIIISVFLISGSLLIFIAGIGILRLPDIYMRMHALTKATSLAIMLMLIGAGIYFPVLSVFFKALIIIVFLYLTIPVAANLLGKSFLEMKSPQRTRKKKKEADEK
ncbi:MAG: monovalent cation/H(+) antiporter subunit G [Bacteroidota bacterium]